MIKSIKRQIIVKEAVMNGYYNDYSNINFETLEERQNKIKKQRNLFSRVFLALVAYVIITSVAVMGIYEVLYRILSENQYASFEQSPIWSFVLNLGGQYLFGFPAFLLLLIGTKTTSKTKKETLTGTELFLLIAMAETLMYAGSFIGNFVNNFIGGMIGRLPENNIAETVSTTPVWLIFIGIVIIAPIFEELIFRKLMIDRLSVYGDKIAIIFSSVAFGLMHGNLYQFFYAALLGALFGYVYTRTKNIKYTMFMHMIVNFLGSIAALPVEKAINELYEILEVAALGQPINILALIVCGSIMLIYTALQYGFIIAGIIAMVQYAKSKKFAINPDREISLPDNEIVKHGIVNVGAISFIAISALSIITSIIFG